MNTRTGTFLSRLLRCSATLVAACLSLALPASAGETLYATGGGGLCRIDPATGAATEVWVFPGVAIYAGGLAYDATTDTLYATGNIHSSSGISRLFAINRHTGVLTAFAGMSPTVNLSSGGLALHPQTGVLYATGQNGFQSTGLFTIDKTTGAETLIGQSGGQCCTAPYGFMMNGIGFRSDGTLFANGLTLSNPPVNGAYSYLYTVDTGSGLATQIGLHGVNVGRQLLYSGLAFGQNGALYSLGSLSPSLGGLYTVDPGTGAATPIGDLILPIGVDGGLVFVPDGPPVVYCTPKTNSLGCAPSIGFAGLPSATSAAPFTISAVSVLNRKPGLLLYGYSQSTAPFQGGFLCMSSPTRRLAAGNSGGNPAPAVDCSGSYSLDFNQRIQGGLDPLLVPGQEVDAQYWSRDPADPFGSGLTDAVSFQVRG
jgi:hypothetical protein